MEKSIQVRETVRDSMECLWAFVRDTIECLWALLRPETVRDGV